MCQSFPKTIKKNKRSQLVHVRGLQDLKISSKNNLCSSSFQNPVSFFWGAGWLRGTSCTALMLSMVGSLIGISKLWSTTSLVISFLMSVIIIIHMKCVPTNSKNNVNIHKRITNCACKRSQRYLAKITCASPWSQIRWADSSFEERGAHMGHLVPP